MADLIDFQSASDKHILSDDATPTLRLTNTSTGPGLTADNIVVTGTATIATVDMAAGTLATTKLTLDGAIGAANATVTQFHLDGASRASGAVLTLTGDAFVSATSIDMADNVAVAGHGAIRIVLTDGTFGWIPVFPDARIDAAAI